MKREWKNVKVQRVEEEKVNISPKRLPAPKLAWLSCWKTIQALFWRRRRDEKTLLFYD